MIPQYNPSRNLPVVIEKTLAERYFELIFILGKAWDILFKALEKAKRDE